MRKFIIKSVLISLPIILTLILMEVLLRNIPNDYSYKKEYLDKHAPEIETLILGSSHTFRSLNPTYFSSKTFNASHISQSFNYDLAIFEKYESKFKNLKTIILPLSYFSLFGKLEVGSESWRVKNYVIYYDMNVSKDLTNHSEILSHRVNANFKRLKSYYISHKPAITCSKLGWGARNETEESKDLTETGEIASLRHTRKNINGEREQQILNENQLILKKIVEYCKLKNIRLVLITTPTFKTYYKNLNKEQLDITIETGINLDAKNDNVIYLNYLSDDHFRAEDFHDADHLSSKGAKKLSEKINEEVNKLQKQISK